ncbi:MAG: LD-carboxypeptidase [Crocinitomicaceae bacterium]
MKLSIEALQKGDIIAIVAPAKAIEHEYVSFTKEKMEALGYKVIIGKYALGRFQYYSGTIPERLSDFQEALDNPDVKAILCARGGYGCVQLVDILNWSSVLRQPKWIIGFSDITVFHQRLQKLGLKSIHGTMPLNFKESSDESFSTLIKALEQKNYSIKSQPHTNNKLGTAEGMLVGGNLSILYSLLGTDDQIDYSNTILFIEDISEQLYVLDRMMFAFKKAGILDKIKGLIVGGMTNMPDTTPPIGETTEQIILKHFQYSKTPVCFDFPAGHINDNRALRFGSRAQLSVTEDGIELKIDD